MADLIDRYAAIDVVGIDEEIRCEMCENPMHTDRGCDGGCIYDEKLYKRIMQILDERIKPLPSAQPEPRWIPCSERLPEIDKEVLVTDGEIYWVCSLFESPDTEDGFYQWEDNYGHWHEYDTWIAWMPLPEPYKEGEQDE